MNIFQILILAAIQGAAEMLPVSSSAHVILAEKLMGLDPGAPEMTFLLVMLHTGTMFAVLLYFWKRWKPLLSLRFLKFAAIATAATGIVGFGLKVLIEKVILEKLIGMPHGEVEHLFRNLPLIGAALFAVGVLIVVAGRREYRADSAPLSERSSALIGVVQGLCLPFRGFSRSGATISTGLFLGVKRSLAEDFSFLLAVILTPPVILLQLHRLAKSVSVDGASPMLSVPMVMPGLIGMVFSFVSALLALRLLSAWLENGRWKYFGFYCIGASAVMFGSAWVLG